MDSDILAHTGLRYQANPYESKFLYDEIFIRDAYDILSSQWAGDGVIVDVGANVGMFAAACLRKWPDAHVVCVEGAPEVAGILEANLSTFSNVDIRRVAAVPSSSQEVATFRYFPRWTMLSGVEVNPSEVADAMRKALRADVAQNAPVDTRENLMRAVDPIVERRLAGGTVASVPATTLNALIAEHAEVEVLKLDVEGLELELLESLESASWSRLNAILLEPEMPEDHRLRADALLRQRGYTLNYTSRTGTPCFTAERL